MNNNSNAVARIALKPNAGLRPPSPADPAMMPMLDVPGSPFNCNAVASMILTPTWRVRPPSPATRLLMPIASMPGSPFQRRPHDPR
jgi:hypothetical protein